MAREASAAIWLRIASSVGANSPPAFSERWMRPTLPPSESVKGAASQPRSDGPSASTGAASSAAATRKQPSPAPMR